jgi:hypothetical protein
MRLASRATKWRTIASRKLAEAVPAKVLDGWARQGFPMPDGNFKYTVTGKPILYQGLVLNQPWESFDIQHELTRKGIEKFVADYRATLSQAT